MFPGRYSHLCFLLVFAFIIAFATGQVKVPLVGSFGISDEWSVVVAIGTPPQGMLVQADTGSGDLLVYSKGCSNCGPATGRYDPASSKSYSDFGCGAPPPIYYCELCHDNLCAFSDAYGDGSYVNYTAGLDAMKVGQAEFKGVFGAIYVGTTDFEPSSTDGIWGIGPSGLSSMGTSSAFEMMMKQNNLYHGFSMCIRNGQPSSMTVGIQMPSTLNLTSPLNDDLFYSPDFMYIAVDHIPIPDLKEEDYGLPIIDSGTTALVVPNSAFSALQKSVLQKMDCRDYSILCKLVQNPNACDSVETVDFSQLPMISIIMRRKDKSTWSWDLGPEEYMIRCDATDTSKYQWGINRTGPSDLPTTILGDVAMQKYNIYFDISQKMFGFEEVTSYATA
jgi:hypothetical protein